MAVTMCGENHLFVKFMPFKEKKVHINDPPWITAELEVVFNKREVVFYQSTKGRGRSPRPFVL